MSTKARTEICEYPDSNKVGVYADAPERGRLRLLFRAGDNVDYWEGEF